MSHTLSSRQSDALRELANMGCAQAASMLARLVGDVGVLTDVPLVLSAEGTQVTWVLGGHDVKVQAALFSIEGGLQGQLWWLLTEPDAQRLGQRLLARPGVSGPLSSTVSGALAEAANIVASACLSSMGTVLKVNLLPSPPSLEQGSIGTVVERASPGPKTVLAASFVSTNAPTFSGWLLILLDAPTTNSALSRLGL